MFGLGKLKSWVTSSLVKKYTGSWIRGGMRVLSGFLLSQGLADPDLAEAFTGSLGEILVNGVDLVVKNPELLGSLVSGGLAQWWSLKEKKKGVENGG